MTPVNSARIFSASASSPRDPSQGSRSKQLGHADGILKKRGHHEHLGQFSTIQILEKCRNNILEINHLSTSRFSREVGVSIHVLYYTCNWEMKTSKTCKRNHGFSTTQAFQQDPNVLQNLEVFRWKNHGELNGGFLFDHE